jgi:glycosyltransferase involved in cell wall biosynthesis
MNGAMLVVDALAARFGGTAYALIQLVATLAERDDVGQVQVVTQPGSLVARGFRPHPKVRLLTPRPWPGAELAWRAAWEAVMLPQFASRVGADALVTTSGMLSRLPACPVISLLSNSVPFVDRWTSGNWVRRCAIARTSRRARAVYVPTHHMGELVGFSPNVKVVPWGVDHTIFHPGARSGDGILYVSDFYPHKRHDLVLAAWRLLSPPRPTLRFIGNPDVAPGRFKEVRETATNEGVEVNGWMSQEALAEAYRQARVLVLASERESFSMPVAEALACGVPAIVRDLPSLRETGGPGIVAVGGDDPDTWTEAIHRTVHDDALHRSLREAGLAHAARFSWEEMAAKLMNDIQVTARDARE